MQTQPVLYKGMAYAWRLSEAQKADADAVLAPLKDKSGILSAAQDFRFPCHTIVLHSTGVLQSDPEEDDDISTCSDELNDQEAYQGYRVVRVPLDTSAAEFLLKFCYGDLDCHDPALNLPGILQLARLPHVKGGQSVLTGKCYCL